LQKKLFREDLITDILKENTQGLSITELVSISNLPRSKVRIFLAKLEGAGKIKFRNIGMAKLYHVSNNIQTHILSSEYKKLDEKVGVRF
jgi:predicted transcriptional regulator